MMMSPSPPSIKEMVEPTFTHDTKGEEEMEKGGGNGLNLTVSNAPTDLKAGEIVDLDQVSQRKKRDLRT